MSKIYEINYNTLVKLLLPTFLRKPLMIAFLKYLVSPVTRLYNCFTVQQKGDLFKESIDCSIPRLEFLLNTMFYPEGLNTGYDYRIIIDKIDKSVTLRIYLGAIMQEIDEGKSQFLNPQKYICTNGETGGTNVDFIVKVPRAVQFDESRMKIILQSYALLDKTFEIIKY